MNFHWIKKFAILSLLVVWAVLLHAETPSPALCLQNVQKNCGGLENDIETCLAQRSAQFDAGCVDFLRDVIGQVKNPQGLGACFADIKRLCTGTDIAAITACMSEKHDQFSAECQKQMDAK